MKVLCVAEKPSIAKSITSILSSGHFQTKDGKNKYCKNYQFPYKLNSSPLSSTHTSSSLPFVDAEVVVTSVLGHLLEYDLDGYSDWRSCLPEQVFLIPLKIQINSEQKKVKLNLEYECKHAQLLIIWTDCDREGEHIGKEIARVCLAINPRIQVKRAKFSVIQPREIHYAMQNLVALDENQCDAVDARMELDLRLGAALTRFLTLRFQNQFPQLQKKVISYGPCQFPTLGFVVDRYLKNQSFVSEPFYKLQAKINTPQEGEAVFLWDRDRLFDLPMTQLLLELCQSNPYGEVIERLEHPKKKFKPYPLCTVEFQKQGTKFLRLSGDKLMKLAEQLYQKGWISYPRTETNCFAPTFDLKSLISRQTSHPEWGAYASRLLNDGLFDRPRNGKNDDKAHPPIHPTKCVTNLTGDEKRVYEFITKRFLSCCSRDAEGMETKLELLVAETERFHASGLAILHRYFLDIDPCMEWQGTFIPSSNSIAKHQTYPVEMSVHTSMTSAPDLLTESELIGEMDRHGIGTDATIHEHIKKILDREYIMRQPPQGPHFIPSTLGLALILGMDLVSSVSFSKPTLRAALERDLKAICLQEKTKDQVIHHSLTQARLLYRQTVLKAYFIEEALKLYLGDLSSSSLTSSSSSALNRRSDDPPRPPGDDFSSHLNNSNRPFIGSTNETHPSSSIPLCLCQIPAMHLRVQKAGPNQGRMFWGCAQRQCQFFEWSTSPSSSTSSNSSNIGSSLSIGPAQLRQGTSHSSRGTGRASRSRGSRRARGQSQTRSESSRGSRGVTSNATRRTRSRDRVSRSSRTSRTSFTNFSNEFVDFDADDFLDNSFFSF